MSRKHVFSEDDIVEVYRLTNQDGLSSRQIADIYGVGKSTIGDLLRKETYKDFWQAHDEKPIAGGNIYNVLKQRKKLEGNKFVFTSAQNNTFVHTKFVDSLLVYCEHNNAELIVGRYVYNKNGFQHTEGDDIWYDPKIRPYLCAEGREITPDLMWAGELSILPTATTPMSGLHNYTNGASCIIPHAKLQMESQPTPASRGRRTTYTTGTVTQRNYKELAKAGQKAAHHHSFAALIVEVDNDGDWFVRQLAAESKTGNFYDLTKFYTPDGVVDNCEIEAINYGDIHAANVDNVVAEVSWRAKDSLLDTLKPKYQMVHDSLDFAARNSHTVKDTHFLFKMFNSNKESVSDELRLTADVLVEMKRDFSEVIVVESNHDLQLLRYLKSQDYRQDPINAIFFLEMQLATYKAIRDNDEDFACFQYACHQLQPKTKEGIRFLKTDESFMLCGKIEAGQHGHAGINGSRPSVKSFVKQGIPFNTGHTHSPSIFDATFTSGTSSKLKMGYNTGSGSWQQAHILTYKNGKRTILNIVNGKWKG